MSVSSSEQKRILKLVVDSARIARNSIDSISCKIDCYEDNVGLLYEANWTMAEDHILLKYTHVTAHSKGLPSAFYFDGKKCYFIEVDGSGGSTRSTAFVLADADPFGEPSPIRTSYLVHGIWLDELITKCKSKIVDSRESSKHGTVYEIRVELDRRTFVIEVAPKYGYAIIKTSELRQESKVITEADDFEPYANAWLPEKCEFYSTWTHNSITASWRRSYSFSFIMANILPISAATWRYEPGSTITDDLANTKISLTDGNWVPVAKHKDTSEDIQLSSVGG